MKVYEGLVPTQWLDQAAEQGAVRLLVFRDWFDGERYPVFVQPGQDPADVIEGNSDVLMTNLATELDK